MTIKPKELISFSNPWNSEGLVFLKSFTTNPLNLVLVTTVLGLSFCDLGAEVFT